MQENMKDNDEQMKPIEGLEDLEPGEAEREGVKGGPDSSFFLSNFRKD